MRHKVLITLAAAAIGLAGTGVAAGGASAATPTGAITGTVHLTTGAGAPSVAVQACTLGGGPCLTATTDATGAYLLSAVPAGTYTLLAMGTFSFGTGLATVTPPATTTADLVVNAGPPAPITGHVTTPSATAAGGASVAACNVVASATFCHWSTVAAADGSYTLNLPPGTFDVSATLPGFLQGTTRVTLPAASSIVDVALVQGASISGRVFGPGNVPVAGVYVWSYGSASGAIPTSATTASDGRYTLTGLAAGTAQVYVGPPPPYMSAAPQTVTVTPPNTTSGVNFRLQVGGAVTGVVTGPNGPVAGAHVWVATPAALNTLGGSPGYVVTAADGSYVANQLAAGQSAVVVDPRPGDPTLAPAIYGTTGFDLHQAKLLAVKLGTTRTASLSVKRGATLSGTVANPAAAPNLYLQAQAAPGAPRLFDVLGGDAPFATAVNPDGSFSLSGLPAGFVDVSVVSYGSAAVAPALKPAVKTTAGATTTLSLAMPAAAHVQGRIASVPTSSTIYAYAVRVAADGSALAGPYTVFTSPVDATGAYDVGGLPPGAYTVSWVDPSGANASEWWSNSSGEQARLVNLKAGELRKGISATLTAGASISGTATLGAGLTPWNVSLFVTTAADPTPILVGYQGYVGTRYGTLDNVFGTFVAPGLRPGSYKIGAVALDAFGAPIASRTGWAGGTDFASATTFTVAAGDAVTGTTITVP